MAILLNTKQIINKIDCNKLKINKININKIYF